MRVERDNLGQMRIPEDAYYGIQTARALLNFPVSGIRERPEFIRAYVLVKKAAALANIELGILERKRGSAIVRAADSVLGGNLLDQFQVDVFQAGAGTSFNMNVNEVLTNLALEILGREKGDYAYLSPNDHMNMGQSTNDTFPTATHIAIVQMAVELLSWLRNLEKAFKSKSKEMSGVVKSGRTHLMDALPVTLGQEFGAYSSSLARARRRIESRRRDLLELPIGGTATGTGANAHPEFRRRVVGHLSSLCSLPFREAVDSFEMLQSRSQISSFSSSLKELAQELTRICNDLRLLSSGPTTGLAEISLPAVQPGSSIMPGKVNPVIPECMNMVCFQVISNDEAVSLAAQAGQLELNVMAPLMTHNVLQSLALLNNYLPVFQKRCIEGIAPNAARCRSYVERNPSLATFLTGRMGYAKAAELARESEEKGVPVSRLAVKKGLITEAEARRLFDPGLLASSRYD